MQHPIIAALLVWPGIALAQDCEAIKDAFAVVPNAPDADARGL